MRAEAGSLRQPQDGCFLAGLASGLWREDETFMSFKHVLFLLVVLTAGLSSVDAFAGDYTVSYAFDGTTSEDVATGATSAFNETGTTKACRYDSYCTLELARSNLTISVRVQRSGRHRVVVLADGGRSRGMACCYFSDGDRSAERDLAQPLLRLHIYEGRARRRNEVVQNIPLGLLYLQFSELK